MFSKVLIANRGEIAVRIAQTCREMGMTSVAVYSSADEQALHVLEADEAYLIGPPAPRESYLNIPALLRAAQESSAGAVHPGYGFLAENAAFAREVQRAGLTWIGPPPGVIALMGDKLRAKELAESVGVPVVPGYAGEKQDADSMQREAERIGYPVMLKAAAGGGGRGMRAVSSSVDLPGALEGAKREARGAFGDDRIFLEKLLAHPRHIEIQIVADGYGNAVALGERDCSLQRRHQKVVEESPSPALTPELRSAMSEAALRLVRAAGYVNAGTVEFLFDADAFYFLEMNTRIQVEHPVTEMVTGIDLVRLQMDIASGRAVGFGQLDVRLQGHAVEARIYAEDPDTGFLPSSGCVQVFRPPEGSGVRNDVGVYEGAEVSTHYDPMLAKLIVHAETREQAIARMRRALDDYGVGGLKTNRSFLQWIVDQRTFVRGQVDTDFLDREWHAVGAAIPRAAVLAAALVEVMQDGDGIEASNTRETRHDNPWLLKDGWRVAGMPRKIVFEAGDRFWEVAMQQELDGSWRIDVDGETSVVGAMRAHGGDLILQQGHDIQRFTVVRQGPEVTVGYNGGSFHLRRWSGPRSSGTGGSGRNEEDLTAPMPGTVIKVAVQQGQQVEAHEPLVVLEAMKMEHVISAPHEGVVSRILYEEGDLVPAGAIVVHLEAT